MVLAVFTPTCLSTTPDPGPGPEPQVLRGDINADGIVGIDDVTTLIDQLLSGETTDISDVNGDGLAGIDDVTALIDFLLSGSWNN